jgi:hypothetical protein
MNVLK